MFFLLIDFFLYGFPAWYKFNEERLGRPITLEKIKISLQKLGFKGIGFWKNAKKTVILLTVLLIANLLIGGAFSIIGLDDSAIVYREIMQLYNTAPLMLLYLLTVRVVGEEIFFRGFLVQKFGVFLPALLFGLSHALYGSIVQIAGAFILGLILGKAFQANKSLLPNITAHLMYNGVILAILM